jgi:tetratricopeptide (TPR) repeat protein
MGMCAAVQGQAPGPGLGESVIKELFEQQKWQELVRAVELEEHRSADLDYYYGTALAQLSRWDGAKAAFVAGHKLRPEDKRFPTELGGVAFKQKRYTEAARWLHRALRLDGSDAYVKEFLATVYFLQGNLEAALKYWNQVHKPEIDNVQFDPQPRIKPALLDRAFAFSPAGTLRLPDLLTSEARVRGLEIFPTFKFDLAARQDERFDVVFYSQELNGWGSNKWEALLSTFAGVFYQTAYPAYFNVGRSTINVVSLVRWDAQKRRLQTSVASPLRQSPKFRLRAGIDLRNENWEIRNSFQGAAPLSGALNLRREAVEVGFTSFNSGRWNWSTEIEFSHRDYRSVFEGSELTPALLLPGYQIKQMAQLNYELLRIPEHRFTTRAEISSEAGRIWSSPGHTFEKLRGSIQAHWFPRSQVDDYETRCTLRSGSTFGQVPFDELFMLGLERDNDLWMRGHVGTRDGRKGSAPLGRDYFLSNWEIDKKLYSNGIFGLKVGPFVDTGRINGSADLGSKKWLLDVGAQAKVSVLGVSVFFIYGKDVRSGNNATYATVGR